MISFFMNERLLTVLTPYLSGCAYVDGGNRLGFDFPFFPLFVDFDFFKCQQE